MPVQRPHRGPGRALRRFSGRHSTSSDCAIWDTAPAAGVGNKPVTSDVPVLVFAGTLDPASPLSDGQRVAERLTNAVFVEIPGGGHGVATTTVCGRSLVRAFVADPDAPLDIDCIEQLSGPIWRD